MKFKFMNMIVLWMLTFMADESEHEALKKMYNKKITNSRFCFHLFKFNSGHGYLTMSKVE